MTVRKLQCTVKMTIKFNVEANKLLIVWIKDLVFWARFIISIYFYLYEIEIVSLSEHTFSKKVWVKCTSKIHDGFGFPGLNHLGIFLSVGTPWFLVLLPDRLVAPAVLDLEMPDMEEEASLPIFSNLSLLLEYVGVSFLLNPAWLTVCSTPNPFDKSGSKLLFR